jgi:23S rRNA pseudouridine2457 synthase
LAFRYLALFKPYGVLSQFTDREGRATLASLVPVEGVYPVGRLDRDSEGLLLLTDDGPLAHRLTDPRFEHPKTYLVQVERIPDETSLEQLGRGVDLKDGRTRPARVTLLPEPPTFPERSAPIRFRKSVPTAWLQLTIHEGRNRQIRRMTAAVGHPTLRLVRVGLGPVTLGGLAPGEWRELTSAEVELLRSVREDRTGHRPGHKARHSTPPRT